VDRAKDDLLGGGQTVRWVSLLVRLGLAAVFLAAGASKVNDLDASGRAVVAYELIPTNIAITFGAVLPFFEIALGLLLLLGLATRLAAWVAAAVLVAFIAGISSAWARGLNIDCGCFSKGGHLPPGQTPSYLPEILRDLGFLALAIFLIIFPASRFSLDGWLLSSNGSEGDADDE
jgi:uncharacterized membrane protein YphA (DoxX/SURF4 family)